MSANPAVSEIYDKNGVTADIEAKRFDGTRTFAISGDVSGSQTWNGDSSTNMTINASIGSKKVTRDKINDKAVGTGQIDDDAVGLTQIDDNAMTNTATAGDNRLITAGGVRNEIDSAILNRGKDYPPMTPTEINAISETIPTGSTVHVTASGTITDGNIDVRAGEDLRYYRDGNTHYWYSLDGEFKLKQNSKTVQNLGTTKTITSLSQDENGEISASASDIRSASTSQNGIVQLNDATDSTSTSEAATANAVKKAYDHADTLVAGLDADVTSSDGTNVQVKVTEVDGKVAAVNITTDNTESKNNKVTSWSGTPTDTNYPSEKLVKDSLDAIGSQSSTDAEVIAASLNDLNARVSGLESEDRNVLGDATADSIDTQVLKVGGEDVAINLSNKADKVASAASGNFAGLDSNGNLTDSGSKASDFATAAQGSKADSAVQGVKLNGAGSALTPDSSNVVTIPDAIATGESGATNGLMTAADKAKLAGIAEGAEVNQYAFSNVKVGNSTVAADGKTDTIEFVEGNAVTLTPDTTNDKVTFAVNDASDSGKGVVQFMTSQEALDLLAAARLAAS